MKAKAGVLALDQSYRRTGLSVAVDRELKVVRSVQMDSKASKFEKRKAIRLEVKRCLRTLLERCDDVCCVIEQTRFFSSGHVSFDYIKATGALNAAIVDQCAELDVPCYSIDTRAWKHAVLGSAKKVENEFGVPPEKWMAVRFVKSLGFESNLLLKVEGRRQKGTFVNESGRWEYDNDAADSACMALSWWDARAELFTLEE